MHIYIYYIYTYMCVYLSNWRNNCLTNTHLKNKMCANLPHVGTKNANNIIVRPNCQPYQSQAIIKSSRKRLIIGARKDTIHSNLHPVLVTMVRVIFFWFFVQPMKVVLISYSTWGKPPWVISKRIFNHSATVRFSELTPEKKKLQKWKLECPWPIW